MANIFKFGLALGAAFIAWLGTLLAGEAVIKMVEASLPGTPALLALLIGYTMPIVVGITSALCLYWAMKDAVLRGSGGIRTEAFEYPEPENESVWRVIVKDEAGKDLIAMPECYCRVGMWRLEWLGLGHCAPIHAVVGKPRAKTFCTFDGCEKTFHSSKHHWDQTEPMKSRAVGSYRKGLDPAFPVLPVTALVVALIILASAMAKYGKSLKVAESEKPSLYIQADSIYRAHLKNLKDGQRDSPNICATCSCFTRYDTGVVSSAPDRACWDAGCCTAEARAKIDPALLPQNKIITQKLTWANVDNIGEVAEYTVIPRVSADRLKTRLKDTGCVISIEADSEESKRIGWEIEEIAKSAGCEASVTPHESMGMTDRVEIRHAPGRGDSPVPLALKEALADAGRTGTLVDYGPGELNARFVKILIGRKSPRAP